MGGFPIKIGTVPSGWEASVSGWGTVPPGGEAPLSGWEPSPSGWKGAHLERDGPRPDGDLSSGREFDLLPYRAAVDLGATPRDQPPELAGQDLGPAVLGPIDAALPPGFDKKGGHQYH
jgi:hypothetical protein